jgi:hypothetical protein
MFWFSAAELDAAQRLAAPSGYWPSTVPQNSNIRYQPNGHFRAKKNPP